jgi:isopenicillin N synthase-like dioxygenase
VRFSPSFSLLSLFHVKLIYKRRYSTLVDHSIPLENVDAAFALAERFFDLPMEVKQKTPFNARNQGHENRTQVRPSTGVPDPKESIQLGMQHDEQMNKMWPSDEDCPGFRKEAESFMKDLQGLSTQVMELLAEGVGLVHSFCFFPSLRFRY